MAGSGLGNDVKATCHNVMAAILAPRGSGTIITFLTLLNDQVTGVLASIIRPVRNIQPIDVFIKPTDVQRNHNPGLSELNCATIVQPKITISYSLIGPLHLLPEGDSIAVEIARRHLAQAVA